MNIVMVSGHACVRVQKMALPLIEKGHDVSLVSKSAPPYYPSYNSFIMARNVNHYLEAIEVHKKSADVFHVHNEPSWFVMAIKERSDVPVILDIHDSYAARITKDEQIELKDKGVETYRILAEERNNFPLADGLVFPGEAFGDIVRSEFRLNQPSLILPSYLPRQWNQYAMPEWIGGLVYEGRVELPEDLERNKLSYGFRYCEYKQLAQDASGANIDLHFYTVGKPARYEEVYKDIAIFHHPVVINKLMKKISRHDWGLVGNVFETPEWNIAYPNKMFEYIGACVPVVAINAPECSKLIEKYGIGITVESMDELAKRWSEHWECRKNIVKHRLKLTMNTHIGELEDLYREVM